MIPGGESTVMTLGIEREGAGRAARALARRRTRCSARCAGLIMLDSRPPRDSRHHARSATRSGASSTPSKADCRSRGSTAARCSRLHPRPVGRASTVPASRFSASVDGHPVAARAGEHLAIAFHPELGQDTRLHELFAAAASGRGQADS